MTIKLQFAHLANVNFMTGFDVLCQQPYTGDEFSHLCQALDRITERAAHYNKGRLNLFKKYGTNDPGTDTWRLDPTNQASMRAFMADMEKLLQVSFSITLLKKLKLPASAQISPHAYTALRDAGIIEPITIAEPDKESGPSGPKTDSAPASRDERQPSGSASPRNGHSRLSKRRSSNSSPTPTPTT